MGDFNAEGVANGEFPRQPKRSVWQFFKQALLIVLAFVLPIAVVHGYIFVSNSVASSRGDLQINRSPEFKELYSKYKAEFDKYNSPAGVSEVKARLGDSVATEDYVVSYRKHLDVVFDWMRRASAERFTADALNTENARFKAQFEKLYDTFYAGKDFDRIIRYVFDNGSAIGDGGRNQNVRHPMSSELRGAISKLAGMRNPSTLDGFNDLVSSVERDFNLKVKYGFKDVAKECVSAFGSAYASVIAMVCDVEPNVIYIKEKLSNFSNPDAYVRVYVNTLKHELSHHIINVQCGTASPPLLGERGKAADESTANSFALKYLNADTDVLASKDQDKEYWVTDKTNGYAEKIFNGYCQ